MNFNLDQLMVATEADMRLGYLAAAAFEVGLDISGKTADQIEAELNPASVVVEQIVAAPVVVTAKGLFSRLCGMDMQMTEAESLARLEQAVELLPLSPIKAEVQQFLGWWYTSRPG